jgi:hypothetical protein
MPASPCGSARSHHTHRHDRLRHDTQRRYTRRHHTRRDHTRRHHTQRVRLLGQGLEELINASKKAVSAPRIDLCHEVLRLRMVADDRSGRLLRMELESFAHLDPDAVGGQQFDHLRVVLEVGARRVTP